MVIERGLELSRQGYGLKLTEAVLKLVQDSGCGGWIKSYVLRGVQLSLVFIVCGLSISVLDGIDLRLLGMSS